MSSLFTRLGYDIFAPYDASGYAREIQLPEIQVWATEVESVSQTLAQNAAIFSTLAELNAALDYDSGQMAWVTNDSTAANNGIYRKVGASGSGYWIRALDLPFSFVRATATPSGTANAIQATSAVPVSASTLVILYLRYSNTQSPVTVSFNGGAALTILTSSKQAVSVGGLVGASYVAGIVDDTNFYLLSDEAIANVIASIRDEVVSISSEVASDRLLAEQYRDDAVDAAAQAQALVVAASAGFTGFLDGQSYDFGYISDSTTYFNQDWGSITD